MEPEARNSAVGCVPHPLSSLHLAGREDLNIPGGQLALEHTHYFLPPPKVTDSHDMRH